MDASEDPQPPPRRGAPRARNRPAGAGRQASGRRPQSRRPGPPDRARRSRPASPGPRPGGGQPDQRRTVVILSVLSAVVVIVGVFAFALAPGGGGGSGGGTAVSTTVPGTPGTVPESQLVTHRDDATGFSIKYPSTWRKSDEIPADGQVRLILLAGGLNGVSVRVQRTEVPTTAENLANIKAVTDGIVGSNPSAKVLDQRQVTVNGMPGYYYLYTFVDEQTGAEGAHGHYFLFKGRKMQSIIFQAVPQQDFAKLAGVFDQVAESFQSDPDLAPAEVPTSAPTTTAPPG